MSCTIKEDLIKKYTKEFNPVEGKQIAEGVYEYIHTPAFTREFGDFTKGFTKDTTQLKDGYPTVEAIEAHFKRKGMTSKKTLPTAYMDYIDTFTPKSAEQLRKLLIKKTQIAYNNVAKDAAELQESFEGGVMMKAKDDVRRRAKTRLKNQLEKILNNLKVKNTEIGLAEYVEEVDTLLNNVNKALDTLALDVSDYYQNLTKFTYFNAIEDVVYLIDNKSLSVKKYFEKKGIKYKDLVSRIVSTRKRLIEGYVDRIGDVWGELPGKQLRIAERKFRTAFEPRSVWLRNNPGATKADYQKAIDEYVANRVEQEEQAIKDSQKASIKNMLINKGQDISFLDALFGNPRDLTDDIIQIAVEILDSADYNVMRETINKTKEAYDLFQRFKVGKDTRSMESLYGNLLARDEKGNLSGYLISRTKSQYFIDRKEKTSAIKKAEEEFGEDSAEAIKARREYTQWSRINQVKTEDGYKPAAKWNNPKFKYFADKKNKGQADYDMYQFLVGLANKRDQNYLGYPARFRLPAIEKSGLENLFENGVVNWVKTGLGDTFKIRASDVELHKENPDDLEMSVWNTLKRQIKVLVDADTTELKTIPKYFRNYDKVNAKTQSYDLLSIYLMDYWGSTNYAEKYKALPMLEVFRESLATRKVVQRTFGGKTKIAAKLGFGDQTLATVPGDQSNSYKALSSLIEDRLYGVKALGNPFVQKLTSSLLKYTGNLFLIGNYFSAGASVFQGKTMTFIESVGGIDFNRKDVLKAEMKYDADIVNMTADIGKIVPSSKTGLLSEIFESTQDFSAVAKKFAGATRTSQIANTNSLHFVTNMAEHYIQNTLMYSFLQGIKVKNSKGEYINKEGEVVKSREEAMTYDEAYEIDNKGKAPRLKIKSFVGTGASIELKSGLEISLKDRRKAEFQVKRYLNHLNRRLNGNYTTNNQAMAQRHAAGKAAFMLRKWLEPGLRRRYRGISTSLIPHEALTAEDLYYSREIQDLDEGTYTTTVRFIRNLFRDYKNFSLELTSDNWAKLSAREKANILKTVTEVTIMIIAANVSALLYGAAQDEDDEFIQNALMLNAFYTRRLYGELRAFTSITEGLRILRSPAASISLIQNGLEVMDQLYSDIKSVSAGGEFERYEQGKRKGTLKLEKEFKDLVPAWYQTGRKIDEAVGFLYKPVK
tara:strand:- start:3991 stop:7479 length:3489 start_codon:yes stop_codon:yes gene_type:complete